LEDLSDAYRLAGLRLSDLARYLLLHPDPDDLVYPLNSVRDGLLEVLAKPEGEDAGFLVAIRDHPDDRTSWGAYSDWLQDRDRPAAGLHLLDRALRSEEGPGGKSRKPGLDLVKVTPHMAQACKHEGRYPDGPGDELTVDDWFDQYVFF